MSSQHRANVTISDTCQGQCLLSIQSIYLLFLFNLVIFYLN